MDHSHDTVYFAHCYPYTYTVGLGLGLLVLALARSRTFTLTLALTRQDLQNYLTAMTQDSERAKHVRLRVLCRSLAGNICDLLTVTNFGVTQHEMAARKGVVLTARVHPGETNGSWMMKGFIDFITGPSEDAQVLCPRFLLSALDVQHCASLLTLFFSDRFSATTLCSRLSP